jgi:hypothetical protein
LKTDRKRTLIVFSCKFNGKMVSFLECRQKNII